MVLRYTLISNERISMQPYDTDYVNDAHTNNAVLDQQDSLRLDTPGALRQGLGQATNSASESWVNGQRTYSRTPRGNKFATMKQVQRSETVRR